MSKRAELRAQRRAEYNAKRVELVKTRQELRAFKKDNAPKKNNLRPFFGVLSIVVPFLLVVVLARTFMSADYTFSFMDILEELQSVPTFDVSLFQEVLTSFEIVGDWGVFDGFREFLNLFARLLGLLQFIGFMLFNALSYVLSFIRIVFGL